MLLTTKPSGKSDGWNPRSVKAADSSNACAAGVSLCAVLVLRDTVRRFGNVPDADFVAMVDAPCPEPLRSSLEANAIVAEEMDFGTYGKLFGDYLLMRKFYVLKMTRYDKVLLLDTDTIVVGSLRHLLADETTYRCGAALARDPAAARPSEAGSSPSASFQPIDGTTAPSDGSKSVTSPSTTPSPRAPGVSSDAPEAFT